MSRRRLEAAYTRLFADAAGESHFEERTAELAPAEWHPAPRRQVFAFLSGEIEVVASDGERRLFVPGTCLLMEDTLRRAASTRTSRCTSNANEPHEFLFLHYHPKGPRNTGNINDPKLNDMIDKQARTMDKADRKQQIYEIQRYLAGQAYYPQTASGFRSMAYQAYVRDAYPRSDFGLGAEVVPKLWLDK